MDRNKVLTKLQKSGHRPRTSPGLVIDIEYTENGGTYSSLSDWLINTTVVGIKILLRSGIMILNHTFEMDSILFKMIGKEGI